MENRDDPKKYSQAGEEKMLQPDPKALFGDLIGECVKSAIGIDLYFAVTKPKPLDLATYASLT